MTYYCEMREKQAAMLTAFLLSTGFTYGTSLTSLPETGKLFVPTCKATIRVMDASGQGSDEDLRLAPYCGEYIRGFAASMQESKSFCPGDMPNGELVRGYVAFMEKNPIYLGKLRGEGVLAALKSLAPCTHH